jgi:hypothetical protein
MAGGLEGQHRVLLDQQQAEPVSFFRMSNRHTFGAIFGLDMLDPARRDRYRQLIGDMIVSYLTTPAD